MTPEAVEFLIIFLHISPFACWQAPPSWSAFHRSLPRSSSCTTQLSEAHSQNSPDRPFQCELQPSQFGFLPPLLKQLEIDWYSYQPLTPRGSHAGSIPTLLLTKSKLSLSKSFKDQFKAPSSQWFCFPLNFYLFYRTHQLMETGDQLYVSSFP